MKGDFSRISFDPAKLRNRVLLQQGRMMMDADWNEQIAIMIHRLEMLVRDIVGPYGSPVEAPGFEIAEIPHTANDFLISAGRLYVGGLCCENLAETSYLNQPIPGSPDDLRTGSYLAYVDAWEQVVSGFEDPSLLDPALAGQDTALRTRISWRVRVHSLPKLEGKGDWDLMTLEEHWPRWVGEWQAEGKHRPTLKVRVAEPAAELAGAPPSLRHQYRGTENCLYRVEIQRTGRSLDTGEDAATFKWSRENGSVVLRLTSLSSSGASLAQPLSDPTLLQPGDWVEIDHSAGARPGPLLQIRTVGPDPQTITFAGNTDPTLQFQAGRRNDVSLRRWDQRADASQRGIELDGGAVPVRPAGESQWIRLENGVEVQFNDHDRPLRMGDYWVFAARPGAGAGILWPRNDQGEPLAIHPMGVQHYYAPLAMFTPSTSSTEYLYRPVFEPLTSLVSRIAALEERK